MGTAHNHPISFPACNSQKSCELCLDDIPCLHLSGIFESRLTVKRKRGISVTGFALFMPILDHLWAVELVLQPDAHQGWGRQKSERAEDFWGRSVQVAT